LHNKSFFFGPFGLDQTPPPILSSTLPNLYIFPQHHKLNPQKMATLSLHLSRLARHHFHLSPLLLTPKHLSISFPRRRHTPAAFFPLCSSTTSSSSRRFSVSATTPASTGSGITQFSFYLAK